MTETTEIWLKLLLGSTTGGGAEVIKFPLLSHSSIEKLKIVVFQEIIQFFFALSLPLQVPYWQLNVKPWMVCFMAAVLNKNNISQPYLKYLKSESVISELQQNSL